MTKKKVTKKKPWFKRLGLGVRVAPGEKGGPRVLPRRVDEEHRGGEGIMAAFFRKSGG